MVMTDLRSQRDVGLLLEENCGWEPIGIQM